MLSCKVNGYNIAELSSMEVGVLIGVIKDIDGAVAKPMVDDLVRRLQNLIDIGLDYLTLNRETDTLSGGESQRIKLASELHKEGSIYVIDEPTTGLHKSDTVHLLEILNKLVDGGNTVIIIEHNMDVVRNADWVVDLGPEGGSRGGEVIFEGTPADLKKAKQWIKSSMRRSLA